MFLLEVIFFVIYTKTLVAFVNNQAQKEKEGSSCMDLHLVDIYVNIVVWTCNLANFYALADPVIHTELQNTSLHRHV